MTFYWWSHWFWITLLSSVYLRCGSAYAYPSQNAGMPEYKNYNKPLKSATKLAPTSTTLHWVTTLPSRPSDVDDLVVGGQSRTRLQNISTAIKSPEASGTLGRADKSKQSNSTDFEYKRSTGALSNATHYAEEAAAAALTEQAIKMDIASESREQMDSSKGLNSSSDNKHKNVTASPLAINVSSEAAGERLSTTSVMALSLPGSSSVQLQAGKHPNEDHPPFVDWHSGPILEARASVPLERNDSQSTGQHKVLFTLENASKGDEMQRSDIEHRTRKSKVLTGDYKQINGFSNYPTDSKNLLARSASSGPSEYEDGDGNASSEALAIQRTYSLDASGISAICFTVFGVCCTVGTVGIVLYRRRFLNKPQALSEPDSSVYIDDSTMRDNSDEMYSLDNDSFLNSLEAMTIQNYWTDTVKHTKL